jgi:hypothetical protein
MAAVPVWLSDSQLDDVRAVCDLGTDLLAALVGRVQEGPPTIRWNNIVTAIGEAVGPERAPSVRRLVFGLTTSARRRDITIKDVVDGVTDTLRTKIGKIDFVKWLACRDLIEALLSAESVSLATKAADLANDVERTSIASRLLIDIRPVFNEDRTKIVGTILMHTLRMEYMTPEGEQRSVGVVMDIEDVRNLKNACDQAIKKAEVTRADADRVWEQTLVPGEE